jgi:Domain of unknown function (DUF5668)
MGRTYRYRSFFWPALLVLIGVVALLVNTGQIAVERLGQLIDLWPLVLIVIGIELILRRTVSGVAGDIAAALVILLAIVGAASYITLAPNPAASRTLDVSGPLAEASGTMRLSINVGGAKITIADTAPSDELYHAHIDYNGNKPQVAVASDSNTLEIDQRGQNEPFFQARTFVLDLALSTHIRWLVEVNSGAATISLNIAQAQIGSLRFNTGASTDDIALGAPSAVVPLELNAGAVTVRLHRPNGTPVSVEVSGAGLNVNVDGRAYHAIGHVTAPRDLGTAGYRLRVNGGACNVTVDTAVPSD